MHSLTQHALLARVATAQREGRLPSLAAGAVRVGLEWFTGRGRVDGHAPTADTQYRIGSITKTFTAVLVMRLRDEGRLRLDDPVDRHVPGSGMGNRTVGQLLTHTAGVQAETGGEWWERTPGRPWSQLEAAVTASGREDDGAAAFHYSNVGYALLGQIVEHIRGRSWWEALVAEVLAPLEMRRTTFAPDSPFAPGLAVHPWADLVLPEPTPDTADMAPAGQLWSTTSDLARWAELLLGRATEVLDPGTVEEMCQPTTTSDLAPDAIGYGLGVSAFQRAGRTLIGHGGSMPGFVCALTVDRAEQTAALALSNATSGLDGDLTFDLLQLLRTHEPRIVEEWAPGGTDDPAVLGLTGIWYWGPTPFSLASAADGALHLAPLHGHGRAARFTRLSEDRWRGRDGYYAGEVLTVVRAEDGTAGSLDIASFVFTRRPYDPSAPIPGGVDEDGWRA
jgi:CubicO group peptidase (beta-lactamase class C family)